MVLKYGFDLNQQFHVKQTPGPKYLQDSKMAARKNSKVVAILMIFLQIFSLIVHVCGSNFALM